MSKTVYAKDLAKEFRYGHIVPDKRLIVIEDVHTIPEELYKELIRMWHTGGWSIYPFPVETNRNRTPLCEIVLLEPINGWKIEVTLTGTVNDQ